MKITLNKSLSGFTDELERIIIKDGTITYQTFNPQLKIYINGVTEHILSSEHWRVNDFTTTFYYETEAHILYVTINVIDYVYYGESHGKVELDSKITGTTIATSTIKKLG